VLDRCAAGTQITYLAPAEFKPFVDAEIERYRKVVADSGARVE